MNYLSRISLFGILFTLFSCGEKKDDKFKYKIDYPNGFKITHYSAAQENNWIATGGSAIFKFTDLEDNGNVTIEYLNYSDTYGDCVGEITGSTSETDIENLIAISDPVSGSEEYDITTPYKKPENPFETLTSSNSVIVKVVNYQVTNISLSGCSFPNYSENNFVIQLYRNGDMIITDWNRSLDYFLTPN